MEGQHIPGVSRQMLKQIKAMSLQELRIWLMEYAEYFYNLGISDCREALRAEFGFGDTRLKRMTDCLKRANADSGKGDGNCGK